jgi:hypothetical protein
MNKPEKQLAEQGISLVQLVHKANDGEKQALSALRQALTSDHAASLMEIAGNLAGRLEESTLNAMLGDQQPGTKLVLLKKLNAMRVELGWNSSPKLERILIERVCQTWLYLHWLELADSQSKNRPIEMVEHDAIRIERAERRHLQAVKMLATIRKMALPLQIDLKAELTLAQTKSNDKGSSGRFDCLNTAN